MDAPGRPRPGRGRRPERRRPPTTAPPAVEEPGSNVVESAAGHLSEARLGRTRGGAEVRNLEDGGALWRLHRGGILLARGASCDEQCRHEACPDDAVRRIHVAVHDP